MAALSPQDMKDLSACFASQRWRAEGRYDHPDRGLPYGKTLTRLARVFFVTGRLSGRTPCAFEHPARVPSGPPMPPGLLGECGVALRQFIDARHAPD